jgi:hypothetical protein
MFADIIGLVVYVDDIRDRNNFWRRPNRHVVLMNERRRLLIVHIQDPHLVRTIWQWRPTASGFRTMATLHVRKNAITHGVTTTDYSEIIFSPIGVEPDELRDQRIWLLAEPRPRRFRRIIAHATALLRNMEMA